MEEITFTQCFIASWKKVIEVVVGNPVEVAGIFALLFLTNVLVLTGAGIAHGSDPHSAAHHLPSLASSVRALVTTACTVFVVRSLMFSEYVSDPGTGLWRAYRRVVGTGAIMGLGLALLLAVMGIVIFIPLALIKVHGWLAITVTFILDFVLVVYLYARFSLINIHVMLGGARRWKAAWRDSRGYVWQIIGSHVVTLLPTGIPCWIVYRLIVHARTHGGSSMSSLALTFVQTLFYLPTILALTACTFWIYQQLANALRTPQGSEY